MNDPRVAHLFAQARAGRLSRRQLLETGLRLGLATPVISGLLATAPAAGAAQGGGGTFTALISAGTEDLDPHSSYSETASAVALGAYEMLLQYQGESTSEFAPMLAESWEANADGSVYTFKLPANALFHDGTTCDAQAVKDSFTRFLQMGLGPVNVISRFVADPNQIEVVDPTTVRFNLGTPQPLFLAAMASSYGPYVVSPTAVNEHKTDEDPWAHEWLMTSAVGTGPYQITEYSVTERVVFTRFEGYHRGWDGNHFDQIVFRVVPETSTQRQLLEQGEADALTFSLTPEDLEAMRSNPDLQVLVYPTTRVDWDIMNAVRLKTKEVRQGFSYAFPYDDVLNGVYRGLLKRSGPIPTTVRGYDPNVFLYQTDLARAKELILSGFEEGTTFEYVVDSSDELDKATAQLFQANLQQIGFDLEISALDGATIESIVYSDTPPEERPHFIGGWAWWPDYNDPWNQLYPNFTSDAIGEGGSNAGGWVNDRFEQIMAEAEHYTDETQLQTLMTEAQNILTEQDPPAIFYGQVDYYTILRADIQGFYANPLYLDAYPFYQMSRA